MRELLPDYVIIGSVAKIEGNNYLSPYKIDDDDSYERGLAKLLLRQRKKESFVAHDNI
jgi:hypothetical protein